MNLVILKGNLTRAPETKEIREDLSITDFGVAVSKRIKKGEEWVNEAEFIECKCWKKRGETIANNFDKGDPILVKGELSIERWEKDGEKKSKAIVIVNDFEFCDRKEK